VEKVSGEPGRFKATLRQRPRYVDMEKCIACGECARKCPKKVADEYNARIGDRKAIFVRYPQAVPLKYRIDDQQCIKLLKGKCGACEKICPTGAIRFDDREKNLEIEIGSIILAPGFKVFDPSGIRTWGYGTFPNVITAMELERYLSASGPTAGHLIRPSDKREARRIAFLQCVGSRDYNQASHGYCSTVCCMFAIKEAMVAMGHVKDLKVSFFYMDVRTPGKGFERYYEQAKEMGIRFHRCRVHSLEQAEKPGNIYLRYITDQGKQVEDEFDLVVLSVGMEARPEAVELARTLEVELNPNQFVASSSFAPVGTRHPGIYSCGCFGGPRDIPLSVMEASAAASAATLDLAEVRHSLTRTREFPQERPVQAEEPRIGVFICHCGSNIAGVIDVEELADYTTGLPQVAFVERNLFTCSQDSQNLIQKRILAHKLNRIVVAACTPRSHEPLFRQTLKASGLNEYLFEMANIRNQSSWVHANEPAAALAKAKDMVRMAVAKVSLLQPLPPVTVEVNPQALVIGGGVVGLVSALGLADQGFPVHLVEKSPVLGGNARHLFTTWKNEPIADFVEELTGRVQQHPGITTHLNSEVIQAEGYVGNFRSVLRNEQGPLTVDHGVAVLATGARAYKPEEYGYGESQRVLTALEFDKLHMLGDSRIRRARAVAFIQCVGSRIPERPYCSRICCTHSVQAAVALKEKNPDLPVFILYRDMRTFGQREELYKKARDKGVLFINYEPHQKPEVQIKGDGVEITVWDHVLLEPVRLPVDILVLATAVIPNPDTRELAQIYKVPLDTDGFLLEAHAKLRPVDFSNDGLFLAGLAHYPKFIEESIAQAQAAVGRAVTVLANKQIALDAIKSQVDPEKCDGCALCLDVCPYQAISLIGNNGRQRVEISTAKCKGCGLCAATCPKEGVNVAGFSSQQLSAQIQAAFA
jgi:heterodisulfide reductase subunit A2